MRIKGFKLEEYFAKYEFNIDYSLCSSDCESFSVNELPSIDKNSSLDQKVAWMVLIVSILTLSMSWNLNIVRAIQIRNPDVLVISKTSEKKDFHQLVIFIELNLKLRSLFRLYFNSKFLLCFSFHSESKF